MRLTKFASVFAVAMAAAAAPAESSRDKSLEFQKKAVAAYQLKDWAAFLENSRQAERFTPGHPRLVYNLACAEALTGDDAARQNISSRFSTESSTLVWRQTRTLPACARARPSPP